MTRLITRCLMYLRRNASSDHKVFRYLTTIEKSHFTISHLYFTAVATTYVIVQWNNTWRVATSMNRQCGKTHGK